jgi:hypothetical protein
MRCVKIGPHITPTPAKVAIFEALMVSSAPFTTSDMEARIALKKVVSAALRTTVSKRNLAGGREFRPLAKQERGREGGKLHSPVDGLDVQEQEGIRDGAR